MRKNYEIKWVLSKVDRKRFFLTKAKVPRGTSRRPKIPPSMIEPREEHTGFAVLFEALNLTTRVAFGGE